MKHFGKILSVSLALMMVLTVVASAGAIPDQVIGSIQYPDTRCVQTNAYANYYAIMPGHDTMDDGFGVTNPVGLGRNNASYVAPIVVPLFEMLAYDRTSGAFDPGKLVSLTPTVEGSVLKYNFPSGSYGFNYNPANQGKTEAFHIHPNEKYSGVVSFTAPYDATFTWSLDIQRQYNAYDAGGNHPYTNDLTGTQLKFYKNDDMIKRATIHDASKRTFNITVDLKRGDILYLEFDPYHNNTGADGVYVRNCRVYTDKHYDGTVDAEYDQGSEKPLVSFALVSDLHTDENIMLDKNQPTYGTYANAVKLIKNRGNIDAVLFGGDILSDNHHHDNNPNYKYSYWTNENIDWTLDYIFGEAQKATEGGKGKVFAVAGNHDKDPGYVASYDKNTNAYLGADYEVHSGDYYPYTSALNKDNGTVLRFNDMWKYDGKAQGYYNSYYNEVVCYRYNVGGVEILGFNQSRAVAPDCSDPERHHWNAEGIWAAQANWIVKQLEEIGKNKTVVIIGHYNFDAYAMQFQNAASILADAFENYPNVIYTYGHTHGTSDQTETWYNSIEHAQVLGDRVQLDDNSYATNGWHYVYIGGMWYGESSANFNQDSAVAQMLTIDFYNDHITFRAHNVGTESTVPGVWDLSTYTVKREMSQLNGYSGNGTGNIDFPTQELYAEGKKYVPTSVSSLSKTYTMDLGINKAKNGQFSFKGIYDLTEARLTLSAKAEKVDWDSSGSILAHKFNGTDLIVTSQGGSAYKFDMRADVGYSSAMIFEAPSAGAYSYDVDLQKLWQSNGECTVYVMKEDGTVIKAVKPQNTSTAINLDGNIYLEKGEELRIVVRKALNSGSTAGNEIGVKSFVVKAYSKYTMPQAESGGNTDTKPCGHTGGTATCTSKAICTKCGEAYGSFNRNNHTSSSFNTVITDGTHKSTYKCCGATAIAEGEHVFKNNKCNICGYKCTHVGYMIDGACANCEPLDAPDSSTDNDNKPPVSTDGGNQPPASTDGGNDRPPVSGGDESTTAPDADGETTAPDGGSDDDTTAPDGDGDDDTTADGSSGGDVTTAEDEDGKGEKDGEISPAVIVIIIIVVLLLAGVIVFIVLKKKREGK